MRSRGVSNTYVLEQIPDASYYAPYMTASDVDAHNAIARGCEHLLRALACMPIGSVSAEISFVFDPAGGNGNKQSRFKIYLQLHSCNSEVAHAVSTLVEQGTLARFYDFSICDQTPIIDAKMGAVVSVIRRIDVVTPLHSSEFNVNIPDFYFTINSFKPNTKNDYLVLDRVLDNITEPVVILLRVEPADISAAVQEHTRYLARLESINSPWRTLDDNGLTADYVDLQSHQNFGPTQQLELLQRPDFLASDILRPSRRFHESLYQPHLRFHIQAMAPTTAVTRLIGSVLAESAFDEGSYHLMVVEKGAALFDDIVNARKRRNTLVLPVFSQLWPGKDLTPYQDLALLSQSAPVDQLSGIFRLPVAHNDSPCCIRKNTDPPCMKEKDLIVLGYDRGIGSNSSELNSTMPRGVRIDQLTKHAFISGTPGSGKTTVIEHLMIQLFSMSVSQLTLEMANTQYRSLKTLIANPDSKIRHMAKQIEIYSPGNENLSPFRFNPLEIIPGIFVDEHIDNLMACFLAAMPITGPLPALLGEALERVYEDHSCPDTPPIMADLLVAAETILAAKGYSPETNSDIRAALAVRIGLLTRRTMGKVFQCRHSVPDIGHLLHVPAIIELDRLPQEQACLLSLFVFNAIREYIKVNA